MQNAKYGIRSRFHSHFIKLLCAMLTHSVNKSNAGLCAYTELKSDRNTYQYVFGYSNVLGNMRAYDDKEIAYLSYVSSQKNSMGEKFLFT